MKTVRRLIYGEVLRSVGFVTLGFLLLFVFFDLVEEVQALSRYAAQGYRMEHAITYVALTMPTHLYELLPITVLIGTISVMARLAQSSEFTILRTGGLGPWRALATLMKLGVAFVALTFAIGDYVSPLADKSAQLLKSRYQGRITVGQTGAWLKERQTFTQYAANVAELTPSGDMRGIRIFEFDNQGFLVSSVNAEFGRFAETDDAWLLENVQRSEFGTRNSDTAKVDRQQYAEFRWPTEITSEMVASALLKPERMSTVGLFQYMRHLRANHQSAQRYEIEFWKKVFYPLSCLVMVVLALPFAYLHFRSGGVTAYVFGGVLAGISFFLLNNVFGYMGNLQNWMPWLTAALPGLIYSAFSLAAFGWLVLRH